MWRQQYRRFFRKSASDGGGSGAGTGGDNGGAPQTQPNQQNGGTPQIDYDRIAQIVDGKKQATEESVLKGYFKQQGLTGEEMMQAINAFKQQKAAQQPDVSALQAQMAQATAAAQQAQLQSTATMAAVELGLDAKTIPYILRMADLSQAVEQDGKINAETVKNALNKVLEDVPALKPQTAASTVGIKVGVDGNGGSQQPTTTEADALKQAFGL